MALPSPPAPATQASARACGCVAATAARRASAVTRRLLDFSRQDVARPQLLDAAASIAAKLGACKLILMTDIRGLLRDREDESTLKIMNLKKHKEC